MARQKIGQYLVVERLGNGGMSSVYRAVDETLGRDVALKILDTTIADSAARLRAEASALARLSHPGIATVYELLEDDDRLVMVMELVRGQTLQYILDEVGVFSPRRAAELCMQALAALAHAHAAGVVHRDLKPGNLMITENGSIKIMDFGIARLEGAINLTNVGQMLGTPAYMAPEQVLGHPVDLRADLYAMGVVFFRLLTAAFPFKGENPFDMAQAQVKETPLKPSELRADLPMWADDIITRSLAKAPGQRFQSAVEFHEALARAIAEAPLPGASVTPAMERTEVMQRPDFSQRPASPQSVVASAHGRSRIPRLAVAAVATVLSGAIWMFGPFGAATPGASNDPSGKGSTLDAKPAAEPTAVPAPSSSDAGGAPAPTPAPQPVKTGATSSRGETSTVPAAANAAKPVLPPASFKNVKVLAVNGSRTTAADAALHFSEAEISVRSSDTKLGVTALFYPEIAKATYVHARDPQWDPLLSGPAGKIDVPGILRRARHWLVLQSRDAYVILRLDGEDRLDVLKAFEDRTGLVVERPIVRKPD
jgi:eukaryotic-like serine/threonine-protein kinase